MLSKKYRLTRLEIEDLKKKRNPILQGKFFGLIFQKTDQEKKFGIIISNKISKKATERNRIKRLFYLAVEQVFRDLNGKFLFLAKKDSLGGNVEDFKKEIENFNLAISNKQ